ncbi:HAMP domain-containing histidine kinase [Ginsengibacter hankyongi]|uniref:histidine kinase n=1 Tax=Ginsengibacter hankyongi TaxID=2607284 RepID=A0A5J5IIC3_9BACT|nr:HAMP domain-containing sensor histidine kinase [Ginsengibacter hankyongi]KAA9040521.1 HAMP domain-containing histidine kinase [Ginsengibacter hankyongi]
MHVRIKITLLFTLIMSLLLALFCGFIYYFFYNSRLRNTNAHLSNYAMSTVNMLNEPEIFDQGLINKIDSITIIPLKHKAVQAYNNLNKKIYAYNDEQSDTLHVTGEILDKVRSNEISFFTVGNRDVVALYRNKNNKRRVILAAAFDEEGKRNLNLLKIILLISFLCGNLIAFTSGYIFSKKLLIPIRKIADDVKDISAQNLAHRIKSGNANDEWNYLTETLNELLDRLQQSFEMQRRFISSASHELSTPLTSISSQLEVALQRTRDANEYQGVMHSVYQDVRQLSRLTQTLLEFATASGIKGGIEINSIRVDEILMQLPGEVTKMNKEYSVKLQFDQLPENEERLLVFGNAELLLTAIKNVVSNACKYSPDHLATIKLVVEPKEIIISVEDSGKGISETDLKNIFQPFYRTEDSKSITGFGVGLPLVYRIIKLHKGQIKVSSVVGKGTTVLIQLPIAENVRAK